MSLLADLPLYASAVTFAAMLWKASSVSTRMDLTLLELRTNLGETKIELAKLTSINERLALLERDVKQLKDDQGEMRKIVTSTDKQRAVTEEQIRQFKEERERSSPDLSRYVEGVRPPLPRKT